MRQPPFWTTFWTSITNSTTPEPTYASVAAKPFARDVSQVNTPTPMEIDTMWRRGPLSEEEKQWRRANRLCLYCSGPGHIAINCPHRPRRHVNQIVACTKPESILPSGVFDSVNSPLGVSDSINSTNSPSISNKFEILSHLEEELNDWVQPK